MAVIPKPNTLSKVWASGGDRATPLDSKIVQGWQIEIPPRQWFNWLDNRQDQAIAHINQHGVAVWDSNTEYQAGKSYTQDPLTGVIYRCIETNINNPPSTSPMYWEVAFASADSVISEEVANARYVIKANNLSDVPNKATARTNLDVYSRAEVNNITSNISTFGVDQTWQDVTGSRALGTTYTNTTGSPIMVNIVISRVAGSTGSGWSSVILQVDGVAAARGSVRHDGESSTHTNSSVVVPPGATYRVLTGAGLILDFWGELR